MIIEESFTIDAPIQKVWDFFLDVENLAGCMPGVERVEQISDTEYEGALKAKVGPISATFGGTAEITEQTPPTYLKAKIKAKDKRTASMINGAFSSNLTELTPNQTEVSYEIDVAIRGKMGSFGQTVIKDTAKSISAIFIGNIRSQLEHPAENEAGEAAAPPPPNLEQPNMVGVVLKSVFQSIWRSITGLFRANAA